MDRTFTAYTISATISAAVLIASLAAYRPSEPRRSLAAIAGAGVGLLAALSAIALSQRFGPADLVLLVVGLSAVLLIRSRLPPARRRASWSGFAAANARAIRAVVAVSALLGVAALGLQLFRHGPQKTPKYVSRHVLGTCANFTRDSQGNFVSRCGLNRHVDATEKSDSVPPRLRDGAEVHLVCQKFGGAVTAQAGHTSSLWDLTTDGLWLSDLFITTSKSGATSRELPTCTPDQGRRQT